MDKVDASAASVLNVPFQDLKPAAKKTRGKGETRQSRKTLFSELLESSAPATADLGPLRHIAPSEEALTNLMDAVHSAGSDLKDRPFSDEILRYKKAVRDFIHYVVENSYEVETVQGIKKKIVIRGQTKWKDMFYHQIRVIDQKLEEIAAAILSGQIDQLIRISKIDEIAGLLVDLTISGSIRERDD